MSDYFVRIYFSFGCCLSLYSILLLLLFFKCVYLSCVWFFLKTSNVLFSVCWISHFVYLSIYMYSWIWQTESDANDDSDGLFSLHVDHGIDRLLFLIKYRDWMRTKKGKGRLNEMHVLPPSSSVYLFYLWLLELTKQNINKPREYRKSIAVTEWNRTEEREKMTTMIYHLACWQSN